MPGEQPIEPFSLRTFRWVLIGYAILRLLIALAGVWWFPVYARQHAAEFSPNGSWSFEQVQAGLAQIGWPVTVPAYVDLARSLMLILICGSVSLVLLWRPARTWFILYLAFVFINLMGGEATAFPVVSRLPQLLPIFSFFDAVGWQFFFLMFYFFPNGRAVPDWTRWLALFWLAFALLSSTQPMSFINHPLVAILVITLVVSAILSQIYRYLRRSDPVQRQQTKWLVASAFLIMIYVVVVSLWEIDAPTSQNLAWRLVVALVSLFIFNLLLALVPLSIALAVLKKGLWEIDLVIRRTLVYGVVSIVLALVYLGGVTIIQRLFTGLTGQQSPFAVVLSTLMIAGLFHPLRRITQNAVDRRFFRSRYDAKQIVASFAAIAREEVELEHITHALLQVTQETMQPERLSLWLKKEQS